MHFAGDGALIVFGLPEPGANDTDRALRFIEALYAAIRNCPSWPGLGLRVGGHSGPVQVAVLGGERHRHLSVSGDVVNTASRLLDVARVSGASLALSESLIASTARAPGWVAKVGLRTEARQPLRGRASAEKVWIGEPP